MRNKARILFFVLLLLCGCTKSNIAAPDKAPPFTVRFIEMVQKNGLLLPKVQIVNQSDKNINGIEFDYRCFDGSSNDITITDVKKGLHGWGMTGEPLFLPKETNNTIVGFDTSFIPNGTVRITATPVWAKFADGTEWSGK